MPALQLSPLVTVAAPDTRRAQSCLAEEEPSSFALFWLTEAHEMPRRPDLTREGAPGVDM